MTTQEQVEIIRHKCVASLYPMDRDAEIGRPTRLADILIAIKKFSKESVMVSQWGSFYTGGCICRDAGIHYDLLHDNLTLQSPETIQAIYNLVR